tara:strand:+ start:162 stop:335 length:174 start_codon:yes stop_codon:yes gene_type:complete
MNEDAMIDIVKAITNIFKETNTTILDQLTIISAVKLTLDTHLLQQVIAERSNPSYIQ